LELFCEGNDIALNKFPTEQLKYDNTKWHITGRKVTEFLNAEKDYIISLIDLGLTNKYIVEKLREKGYGHSCNSFLRWMKNDKELYGYFIKRHNEIRTTRNAGCGTQKQHFVNE
jgi:hypothetical protein